jgi:23S rRNA pseudouridine1911/1915/1917 synthase
MMNPNEGKLSGERQVELVFDGDEPQRLDKFLAGRLPEFSRSRLQAFIKESRVLVNGYPAGKSGQQLEGSAKVLLFIPAPGPSRLVPEKIPLDIVYENEDLLVVNKPAGMVVHPAVGHGSGTLVHAALAHAPDMAGVGGEVRPGVVHRLDKDTSGLILLAKNDAAHQWLQNQFRSRRAEKTYLALVDGAPPTPRGRVEAGIGRDPRDRKRMAVLPGNKGRTASSEYRVLQAYRMHTLLEVHPITGRTHQIRLHLAFLGCPVVGDRVYGRRNPSLPVGRQFLHAARLKLVLLGESEPRTFEAPLPPELVEILAELKVDQA